MDFNKLVRFVPKALALICFIGSAYVFAFVQVGFQGSKPPELLRFSAVLVILMGVFVLVDGLLAQRDEAAPWKKRALILTGLLIALAAAVWYFFGIPGT